MTPDSSKRDTSTTMGSASSMLTRLRSPQLPNMKSTASLTRPTFHRFTSVMSTNDPTHLATVPKRHALPEGKPLQLGLKQDGGAGPKDAADHRARAEVVCVRKLRAVNDAFRRVKVVERAYVDVQCRAGKEVQHAFPQRQRDALVRASEQHYCDQHNEKQLDCCAEGPKR